ncbi:unnamed protein product [Bursaphelenchus okinawaensis]|uniref:Nuclear receptor domain-containing protein n=1 Tax=Bursaphelenchus okinawaensis TaxID=465554 RepID=A0A811K3U8_9BILA|nr:unnamed protein product [Bursaphelenchus okinawaensis]CAG9091697.1 unnamed protein product [Bursaphelenchus okinawaensis]
MSPNLYLSLRSTLSGYTIAPLLPCYMDKMNRKFNFDFDTSFATVDENCDDAMDVVLYDDCCASLSTQENDSPNSTIDLNTGTVEECTNDTNIGSANQNTVYNDGHTTIHNGSQNTVSNGQIAVCANNQLVPTGKNTASTRSPRNVTNMSKIPNDPQATSSNSIVLRNSIKRRRIPKPVMVENKLIKLEPQHSPLPHTLQINEDSKVWYTKLTMEDTQECPQASTSSANSRHFNHRSRPTSTAHSYANHGSNNSYEDTNQGSEDDEEDSSYSGSYDGNLCMVCGFKCPHKNYGVYCCNACAAFFRRTIKQRRSYVCIKGRNCNIGFGGHKRTCRYCRFKRCVFAGMSIEYVMTRGDEFMFDPALDNDMIKQMAIWFTSTFVDRFRSFERSFANTNIQRSEGTLNNSLHTMFVEFDVMRTYVQTSGLLNYLNPGDEITFLKKLFYKWLFVQCVFNTLRHGGHRSNRLYLVDDSSLPLESKYHKEYVRSMPNIKNAEYVGQTHYDLMQQGMKDVWMFHHANVDATDFSIFNHLVCLKTVKEMYPENTRLQDEMNIVFKAAHRYYKLAFKDYPTRMGNLILLMNESEMFTMKFQEWVVVMTLNGVASALEEIEKHFTKYGNYNAYESLVSYVQSTPQ